MTVSSPPGSINEPDGLYFYLSRAQGDRDDYHTDPDFWVSRVFQDLSAAVDRDRKTQPRWRTGYLDPLAVDSAIASRHALAVAEVFVAFYSMKYLSDSRSLAQRSQFLSRFAKAPPDVARSHLLPVLWEPIAVSGRAPELKHALEIAPELRDYTELGLCGLNRLRAHRESYERVLAVLGRWIVDVAEGSPFARWPGPDLGVDGDARVAGRFVVAVLAPRRGEMPRGRIGDLYGPQAVDWRPFGHAQPMPVARHTAVRVPPYRFAQVLDDDPGRYLFADSPGIVLIDPWISALPAGRARLKRTLDRLPEWALPVVVADQNDPQYNDRGAQLVDDATQMCNVRRMKANMRVDVRNVEAFDVIISYWVQYAHRRYRDRQSSANPRPFTPRPRLRGSSIDD
jgi:FxsC-like protein